MLRASDMLDRAAALSGIASNNEFDEFIIAAAAMECKLEYKDLKFVQHSHSLPYSGISFVFKANDDVKVNITITNQGDKENVVNLESLKLYDILAKGEFTKNNVTKSQSFSLGCGSMCFKISIRQASGSHTTCSEEACLNIKKFLQQLFRRMFYGNKIRDDLRPIAFCLRNEYEKKVQDRKRSKEVESDTYLEVYKRYKENLSKSIGLVADDDLNVRVADAVDRMFGISAIDMKDYEKSLLKSDLYEVILSRNIDNEVVLYSVIFTMLIKYYNCGMANADRCKDNIYLVCDKMASNIAKMICD